MSADAGRDLIRTCTQGGDRFQARQTEFGITSYSVLGGALQVQDQLEVALSLAAQRFDAPP